MELLEFLAEYDSPLHCHLDSATVFIGTSSKIQNDLIQSVADVLTEAMREEVRNAPFVSVMALLMGFEFCFLLATFNSVFTYSDVLFRVFPNK